MLTLSCVVSLGASPLASDLSLPFALLSALCPPALRDVSANNHAHVDLLAIHDELAVEVGGSPSWDTGEAPQGLDEGSATMGAGAGG